MASDDLALLSPTAYPVGAAILTVLTIFVGIKKKNQVDSKKPLTWFLSRFNVPR